MSGDHGVERTNGTATPFEIGAHAAVAIRRRGIEIDDLQRGEKIIERRVILRGMVTQSVAEPRLPDGAAVTF